MQKNLKPKSKVQDKPDVPKAVSLMGQKKFNEELKKELLAGIDPNEAPDLIARRKLRGMI